MRFDGLCGVWGCKVLSFGDNTCSLHFWDWLWGCRLSDLLARGTLPTAVTGSSSVSQCLTSTCGQHSGVIKFRACSKHHDHGSSAEGSSAAAVTTARANATMGSGTGSNSRSRSRHRFGSWLRRTST